MSNTICYKTNHKLIQWILNEMVVIGMARGFVEFKTTEFTVLNKMPLPSEDIADGNLIYEQFKKDFDVQQ